MTNPPRTRKPPAVKQTRAEILQARLAEAIVSGRLAPGAVLDEAQIAAAYDVSRTPVREALRQLSASGLVEVRPHRGAVVAKPHAQDLVDMFAVMAELEALCAGLAAVGMASQERQDLEALHERMGALVRAGDPRAYGEANVAFHQAIYAGAHNGYLADLTAATRRRLAPFRRAQLDAGDRIARSHAEHGAVVQAILRGDRQSAAGAMHGHLTNTATAWMALSGTGEPHR